MARIRSQGWPEGKRDMKALSLWTACFVILFASALFLAPAAGREQKPGDLSRELVTLLRARCIRCHGVEKKRASLDLTSLEALARGSENGPVVAPGTLAESALWQMVDAGTMPPKMPLVQAARDPVRQRIEKGAPGASSSPGGTGET